MCKFLQITNKLNKNPIRRSIHIDKFHKSNNSFLISSTVLSMLPKYVSRLRRRKENRSDVFLRWSVLKCKTFP